MDALTPIAGKVAELRECSEPVLVTYSYKGHTVR